MSSIILIMVLGIIAITSCTKSASEKPLEAVSASKEETVKSPSVSNPKGRGMQYFDLFDTVSYVYSYAGDSDDIFQSNCNLAYDILNEYHRLFDIYHEYSNLNNLRTINLNAGISSVKVDEKLFDFLKYAKDLYELTNGEMNIMMGSVLSIWHEARNAEKKYLPKMQVLEEASLFSSFEFLELDEENKTVKLTDSRASIDVGALGKGYATEMAARALEELNIEHYVLNIGGNIRILGTKVDGSSWTTGIRNPKDPDGEFALRISISDCSCVTSGSYERFFTVNGTRYPHIIDKDTLMPAKYFESLTVITKDSALADALSTALYCMSYEDGLELVNKLDDVGCIWIFSDSTIRYTDNIKDKIIK